VLMPEGIGSAPGERVTGSRFRRGNRCGPSPARTTNRGKVWRRSCRPPGHRLRSPARRDAGCLAGVISALVDCAVVSRTIVLPAASGQLMRAAWAPAAAERLAGSTPTRGGRSAAQSDQKKITVVPGGSRGGPPRRSGQPFEMTRIDAVLAATDPKPPRPVAPARSAGAAVPGSSSASLTSSRVPV
jgi:hypothetical protein